MKSRLNYKSRKTIIITVAIIALLALSGTGIYMFTKGNDNAEAFTEGNTVITEGSQNGEGVTLPNNPTGEQTVEPNTGSTTNEGETTTTEGTTTTVSGANTSTTTGTTTSTTGNVPNGEYVTERTEEVEQLVYEGYEYGWTPISLTTLTDDIDLNKVEQQPSYTITKVATLVNGNALEINDDGKIITKVQPGDKVTYVITVENTGNVTLQNIEVSDELVGYEETIAVLAIGDKKEITVEYTVEQDDMDENEEIVNIVKAVVPDPTNPEENIEEKDEEEVPVNPYITVSGTKTWVDNENLENTRPEKITVEVLNGTEVVDTITVTAENGWNYTSKQLPKYADKNATKPIEYTVREANVDSKYTASVNGTTITNTIKDVPTVTVSGSKTWVDYNNQENTRPEKITVEVLNGTEVVDTITVRPAQDGTWSYTSKQLPKYADKNATKPIEYTVREANVDSKYTASVNGTTITNTIKDVPTVTISGSKTWVDYNNQENTRPEKITVEVLNGTEVVDTITVTAENGWNYTSKQLPKYADKNATKPIEYTVREANVDSKYTASVNGNNITNTIKDIPTVTISGSKTWIDYNNQENTRPEKITVEVLNGTEVVDTITVTAENGWNYTSKQLPKYADKNATKPIEYTVREANVDSKYTATAGTGKYDIVNTIKQEKIEISVTKKWTQEPEGVDVKTIRPTSLELQLKGKQTYTYTLSEAEMALNEVTHTFTVDKYDLTDGSIINYTADENADLTNYSKIVEENVITNAYKYTKFTVTKTAYKDEQCTQEVDLNKETDKFAAGETVYYKMTITNIGKIAGNADATDTLPPELENYEIISSLDGISANIKDGILTWNINNLLAGNSQTIIIKAIVKNDIKYEDMSTKTGEETSVPVMLFIRKDKIIQNEDGSTHYNKGDYTSSLGTAYLKEGTAKSYGNLSGELINGLIKVNNEIVDKVQKGVTRKQIKENLAAEGIELKDDEVIIWYVIKKEQDGWHIDGVIRKLEDLPRVTNKIDVVQRGNNEKVSDDAQIEITSVKVIDTTEITVSKVWSDGNNQDGNRPANVKVQLFVGDVAQGDVVTLTVDNKLQADENIWQYTFTGLDKYNSNNEVINYEVKEVVSSGNAIANNGTNGDYTVTYEKDTENKVMTITNSYTPQTTSVTATKVWVDNNNEDNGRPSSITIKLYNGNNVVNAEPVVAKQGNIWTYTFSNLPMYDAGRLITYTAKELRTDGTIVANNAEYNENYVTTYNGNIITNTHIKPVITVTKTSNKTNQDLEYGDTITYTLTATNSGTKAGKVTIKDTIPTGTELTGNINVTVGGTTTTITTSQLAAGYEITVNKDSEATITFSVIVKAYAGEKVTNTGYYKVGDNPETPIDQPTDTVIVNVEDEATVIPTITTTTPVTVPQKAILVLDFSGSMDESINKTKKIASLKSAVNTFLTKFLANGKNEVMIISYSKEASVQCNFTTSKNVAYASIQDDKADGGTNIEAGLKLANSYITTANASTTSVILMTDGLPCYYTAKYEWMGKEYEYIAQEGDGTAYAEKPATAAKNAATAIKNKGSKVYSIGFGLDSISNKNQSRDKAKALLQNIATPSEYNADGVLTRKYYYDTFDGNSLEKAFGEITDSITTTANADPIPLDTDEGIITITKGFKEGQNIEIYTGTYNKDKSKPVATYTWEQFKALEYTTYASNQITFNLGKYMKDNGITANTEVSLRFVDVAE